MSPPGRLLRAQAAERDMWGPRCQVEQPRGDTCGGVRDRQGLFRPPRPLRAWEGARLPHRGLGLRTPWRAVLQFFVFVWFYFLNKAGHCPATVFPGVYATDVKTYVHPNLHADIYSSFIHNCRNQDASDAATMPFGG